MNDDLPIPILVTRFRAGDRAAATLLAERAGTLALRTATAALGDPDQARDVAQEVAIDALRGIGNLRDPQLFDAWAHRIAVRHTMKVLRSRQRRRRHEAPIDQAIGAREPATSESVPDAETLARRESLRAALASLPADQRVALALRYVHDMSEPQIAHAMGCRPGTAGSLLSRGRDALRRDPNLSEFAPLANGGQA